MINRENLVKIGRAGGKTSNRETPDQIGRVGISVTTSHCLTKEPAFPSPKKTRVQRAVGNQAHGREEGEEGVVTRKNEPRGGGGRGKGGN